MSMFYSYQDEVNFSLENLERIRITSMTNRISIMCQINLKDLFIDDFLNLDISDMSFIYQNMINNLILHVDDFLDKYGDIEEESSNIKNKEIKYSYSVARIMKKNRIAQINKYLKTFPDATISLEILYTPNAIILRKHIVKYLNSGIEKIDVKGRNFNLNKGYIQKALLKT